jgi:hypothetical protein
MRPVHRTARHALLVSAALLLLSACGIPTTGVVESGAPGTGVRPPTLLYFIKNGTPVAVSRTTGTGEDVENAVRLLLRGPSREERNAGLTTALLPMKSLPEVSNEGTEVRVQMPYGTRKLAHPALQQLVCTIIHARRDEDPGVTSVRVAVAYRGSVALGIDGAHADCPRVTSVATVAPSADAALDGAARPGPLARTRAAP